MQEIGNGAIWYGDSFTGQDLEFPSNRILFQEDLERCFDQAREKIGDQLPPEHLDATQYTQGVGFQSACHPESIATIAAYVPNKQCIRFSCATCGALVLEIAVASRNFLNN